MAKYSFEFKKKVVQEYKCCGGERGYLAKKYGIASSTNVLKKNIF